MKYTNQLIGCCGLDCETCDARIATITNNDALREKTAALWTKLNAVAITPDMIHCTGCRAEGVKTPFCDKLCPVHHCVREKSLDTCADCGQMDSCPTLGAYRREQPVRAGQPAAAVRGKVDAAVYRPAAGREHQREEQGADGGTEAGL